MVTQERRALYLLAIAVPVALVAGYFLLSSRSGLREEPDSAGLIRELPEPVLEEIPKVVDLVPTPDLAEVLPVAPGPTERVAVEAPAVDILRGRVVDTDGAPLPGVEVSWTSWDPDFIPFVTSSVEIPRELVLSRTVRTTTNASGMYGFELAPTQSLEQPSFLWFTHVGHMASSVPLSAGPVESADQEDVILEPASPTVVEVDGGEDSSLGAMIHQQGAFPQGTSAYHSFGASAPKDQLLFLRSYRVEKSSPTPIAPFEHRLKVWAEQEELRSKSWLGERAGLIKLVLFPSFTFLGMVNLPLIYPERWTLKGWGSSQVRVSRVRGPLVEEVEVVPVAEDGYFGPVVLPLMGADSWRVTLNGSLLVPQRQTFESPEPGEEVYVELDGEVGHFVWFMAVEEDGSPIPAAWVDARWKHKGEFFQQRFYGRENGGIPVTGIPLGTVEGLIAAEGYGLVPLMPTHAPQIEFRAIEYVLPKLPSLHGKCLAGIYPLEDFEIRYWTTTREEYRGTHQVSGSEDGTFVLEHLPSQQISLSAISPEFGRSDVMTVNVSSSAKQELTLFVFPPGTMEGQLVDAQTGEPISDGEIEVYMSRGVSEMDPIGTPALADSSGRFSVSRLARGVNVVSFNAPGYSVRELKVGFEGEDVDLGLIELTSQRDLTVKLLLPEGIAPTNYYLTADGIGAVPSTSFNASGTIRIENADASAFTLYVRGQDKMGGVLIQRTVWLRGNDPWEVVFDMRGGRLLTVVPIGKGKPISGGNAIVAYTTPDGNQATQMPFLKMDGSARVYGLGKGPALVRVITAGDPRRVGCVLIEIDDDSPQELTVEVPLKSELTTLRVVDHDGAPLESVRVEIRSSLWPGQFILGGTTGIDGLCALEGLPDEADSAMLRSTNGATSRALPFYVPMDPDEVVEIVFDTRASITLHITDGGVPQPQVTCRLWDLDHGSCIVPGRSPDANGNLVFDKLGADTYELRLDGYGYWPISMQVDAANSGQSYEVDTRRVGNLELKFTGPDGVAFGNQSVALTFMPTGEDVQDWVSKGKVNPGPGGLRTDGQGRLTLMDIPHGAYRWSCSTGAGEVRVSAGETEEAVMQIL